MTAPTASTHLILPVLVAATALGLLASAIYVPSIPDIARELGVPVGLVQLTLTTYLVAVGVATPFVGALSDRFRRRVVLLAGTVICALASLACAFALSIELLLIGRAVQAIGACTGMVVSRAAVRDIFAREDTARAMAVIAMAATLAPVLAPILGGYVHVWLGWRANFVILVAGALGVMTFSIWQLPETNLNRQTQGGLVRGLFSGFVTLLRFREFLAYTLAIACGGVSFYSFIVSVPVILDRFGASADLFGLYIGIPPIGFLIGSFVTSRLSGRVGPNKLSCAAEPGM